MIGSVKKCSDARNRRREVLQARIPSDPAGFPQYSKGRFLQNAIGAGRIKTLVEPDGARPECKHGQISPFLGLGVGLECSVGGTASG